MLVSTTATATHRIDHDKQSTVVPNTSNENNSNENNSSNDNNGINGTAVIGNNNVTTTPSNKIESIGMTQDSSDDTTHETTTTTTTPATTTDAVVETATNRINTVVTTKYGVGTIIQQHYNNNSNNHNYNGSDNNNVIYEVLLHHHDTTNTRLYCPATEILSWSSDPSNTKGSTAAIEDVSTSSHYTNNNNIEEDEDNNQQSIMELNVAYESLETMRKLNLEMKCQECNILYTSQDLISTCAQCLLERQPYIASSTDERLKKRLIKQYIKTKQKVSPICLICGTPTCTVHSSKSFKKENIIMCCQCEELFGLSYVIQIMTHPDPIIRRQYIDKMIELYDRTVLVLRFITTNTTYFESICTAVQQSTIRKNHVGIGSSSAGIVSGVLGLVSAATIFTPIGPPLLIASLVFGGSATAAQTGTQIRNSSICSEPHRIADKIIALHGICWNILRVTGTLRDALLLDHLRTDLYTQDTDGHSVEYIMLMNSNGIASSPISEYYRTNQHEVLAKASNIGSIGAVGMVGITAASMEVGGVVSTVETGIVATRSATFMSRSGTAAAALNALQFARFAGGTLAAATLLFEAHNLKSTIQAIRGGNACEKVTTIRRIRDLVRDIPSTQSVDAECERYLQALSRRQRILTEQEVTELITENNEIIQEVKEISNAATKKKKKRGGGGTGSSTCTTDNKSDTGSENEDDHSAASSSHEIDISERSRESITRRLQLFALSNSSISDTDTTATQQQSSASASSRHPLSLRERIELHKKKDRRVTSPSQQQLRECNDNEYGGTDAEHIENLIC